MELNFTFKDHIKNYMIKYNLLNKRYKSKYNLDDIVNVFEYILLTGSSWRSLNLSIFKGMYKWQSFYYHFNKLSKLNMFKDIYISILKKYFKKNISGKLKYLSIDTSFIKNECAPKKNVGFNGHYKKKRLSKLSLIVDANGIPLSALLKPGNTSDQDLLFANFNDLFITIDYNSNNNKHKRYLLADSIYDTKEIHDKIKSKNICPIIRFNKRNTKDVAILKSKIMSKYTKKIYKKRMIVENLFSWLYKNRRLSKRYDKYASNYMSFLYMALIKILIKRLN
jgi:transposase